MNRIKEISTTNEVSIVAIIAIASFFDNLYETIRHVNCSILLADPGCCDHCRTYKENTLNRLLYRLNNSVLENKENISSHINHRFMDEESKVLHIKKLQMELRRKTNALNRIENILQQVIQKGSLPVDELLHSDLLGST